MNNEIVSAHGVTVKIDGKLILYNSSFSIYTGEIMAFCQTSQMPFFFPYLINEPSLKYEGKLRYLGKDVNRSNPISAVHIGKTDMLIDSLSIVDNLYAITLTKKNLIYSKHKAAEKIRQILHSLNLNFDVYEKIENVSVTDRYILEIVRALFCEVKLIVLENISQYFHVNDYPWLCKTMRKYAAKGYTFVLLSTEDNTLIKECERVYFSKSGSIVDILFRDEYTELMFNQLLFGKAHPKSNLNKPSNQSNQVALKIVLPKEICENRWLEVLAGEVYGVFDSYGTLSEFMCNMFIEGPPYWIYGRKCQNYEEAVRNGLAFVLSPHKESIFEKLSAQDNILLPVLRKISRYGIINRRLERFCLNTYESDMAIDNSINYQYMNSFLRQFYKWMLTNPKVMVLDNPPLDFEEKQRGEIDRILNKARQSHCAMVLISSNIGSGLKLCDRAIVIQRDGSIAEY